MPWQTNLLPPAEPSGNMYTPKHAVIVPTERSNCATADPTVIPNDPHSRRLKTTNSLHRFMLLGFTSVTTRPVSVPILLRHSSYMAIFLQVVLVSTGTLMLQDFNHTLCQPLINTTSVQQQQQLQQMDTRYNKTQQLTHIQSQLVTPMILPQPEVPNFKGKSIEYNTCIMAVAARIASRVFNNSDRLFYLDRQLEGEPKDLIGGCLYMDLDQGYPAPRSLLHK
jgi:hypothetical protein